MAAGERGIAERTATRSRTRLAAAAIVALLGVRVAYLFIQYVTHSGRVLRYHVESAAVIFVVCGVVIRLTQHGSNADDHGRVPAAISTSLWLWPLFCCGAFLLYWRALSVGFLSDDFVLAARAADWRLGAASTGFFRPFGMLLWAVVIHLGAGPRAFHVLNILLHGSNAYLTARIVTGWVRDLRWGAVAGTIVLTMPIAPEAVVWCSGVFDLLATALLLTLVLAARRYDQHTSAATRSFFVAIALAAIASKETAVIGFALVAIDAWARRSMSRQLQVDLCIVAVTVSTYAALRLVSAAAYERPAFTRFAMQRAVFSTFGELAVPWHEHVIGVYPLLPITYAIVLVMLAAAFWVGSADAARTRLAGAAAAWVMLPIVPVWSIFVANENLQGSRYLDLSMAGWAALIVVAASEPARSGFVTLLRRTSVAIMLPVALAGATMHVRPWASAAQLRDRVEAALRTAIASDATDCDSIAVANLPDSDQGAYVFRNGAAEAFTRDLSIRLGAGGPGCSFEWDEARLSFASAPTR